MLTQFVNIVAKRFNNKFHVLCIDLEGQYKCTINHLNRLKEAFSNHGFSKSWEEFESKVVKP